MTTARDDIDGLIERLRSPRMGDSADLACQLDDLALEAATQLDALQARVKELEAALNCKRDAISEYIVGDDKSELAQARASEAYMSAALSREIEIAQEAESRATRLQQERDEAIAALRPLSRLEVPNRPQGNAGAYSIRHSEIETARDLVRRLAGPEKEGK